MFSLFGWSGQHAYEWLDARNSGRVREERRREEEGAQKDSWLQRVSKSKWSPMKALSDGEYEEVMQEKKALEQAQRNPQENR